MNTFDRLIGAWHAEGETPSEPRIGGEMAPTNR
ncbi:MAG: hypothetical protein QOF49_1415 [Chloroflexota bacterium]|jgi:hypothetical protein|nr:hypothetical protein [Chloroflexota bacterium]